MASYEIRWQVPPFLRQFWRAKKYLPPSFLFKLVTTDDHNNNNNNNDDEWPRPRPAKGHSLPNLGSLVDTGSSAVLPVARSSSLSSPSAVAVSCGPICHRGGGQQRLCPSCKRAKETRLRQLFAARARAERAWWASRLPPPPPGDQNRATRVPEQASEAALLDDEKGQGV